MKLVKQTFTPPKVVTEMLHIQFDQGDYTVHKAALGCECYKEVSGYEPDDNAICLAIEREIEK